MVRRTAAAVMVAVTAAACSGNAIDAPEAVIADSAGIRIVTYDLTDITPPTYRVLGEPDLEIGMLDGPAEYALSRIWDIAVADGGSIVVSDLSLQALRVYDAAGVYRATLGGAGDGPGEFEGTPRIAGLSRDTVFAFELRASRLTALDLAGNLLDDFTVPPGTGGRPVRLLRLDDGTYLSQTRWVAPTDDSGLHDFRVEQDSTVIQRLGPTGETLDTVAVLPDVRRMRRVSQRADLTFSVVQADLPYSVQAVFSADGEGVVLGHTSVFEVRRADLDGSVHTLIRVLGAEDPTPMAQIRSRQEAALREAAAPGEVDPLMWMLNVESLPERLPAFGKVLVADNGDVWVSRMQSDDSAGRQWLVFRPSGELAGSVDVPARTELYVIGTDFVIGVTLGELDVPYVRRWPLETASGATAP